MALKELIKVKRKILTHTIGEIKSSSKLRAFLILVFLIALIWLSYDFSHYIFWLLMGISGAGSVLCDKLFQLFFMSIFFLLIFSNAVSGYATIFKSQEVKFLLRYPLSYQKIFIFKSIESILLTSWAFLFLITPFLYAYVNARNFNIGFIFISFIYILPYLFLAGVIGLIFCMLVIKFFPRKAIRPYLISFLIIGIFAFVFYLRHNYLKRAGGKGEIVFFLSQLMPYLHISQNPYLASYWLSQGLLNFNAHNFRGAFFFLYLLTISFLFGGEILLIISRKFYYSSLTELSFQEVGGKVHLKFWKMLENCLFFLRKQNRTFLLKDLKVFLRDPIQWSQVLVFFGILAVYFGNLQGFYYHSFAYRWRMFIAFLNTAATNLVMTSLAIRFIYPQISLEGKRFWILGIAPISRFKILIIKYLFSSFSAFILTMILIYTSNHMLQVGKEFMFASIWGSGVCAFTVMAIIIGLSAIFPSFKEDNPSRIIAGFGGTVSLISSLLLVCFILFILAFPFHLRLLGKIDLLSFKKLVTISMTTIFLLGLLLISVFLFLGKRALERAEF